MVYSARILVTGANGFVGRAAVDRLVRDGHHVIAIVRGGKDAFPGADVRIVADPVAADWAFELAGVDVLLHCAARTHIIDRAAREDVEQFNAVNVDWTLALARAAAAAGVRRFVYLSSAHVLGGATDGVPLRAGDLPAPANAYARSKLEAERGLADIARDTGLEIVIVRPPLVMGVHPKGNLATLVNVMRRGLPLPLGGITRNRRDVVSLETLADLIACTIAHPNAPGEPLLVSDGLPLSTRQIVDRLASLHGTKPFVMPVPTVLLNGALKLLGREAMAGQLIGDLEIDISATRQRLDWTPPTKGIE